MAGAYGNMPDEKKMMAENDLHTLIEAEKIKKDAARFSAAKKCAKEKMAAIATIIPEKSEK